MKRHLESFNLQSLERIMNELGAVPRIFNSEAQFQFELAWKIKEEFDCEVKLEELSRTSQSTNYKGSIITKKDYTDIIIEDDRQRIALELKYKTATPDNIHIPGNILLMNHGAADLGAYDFLWDVHRIQILTGNEDEGEVRMPCNRGYAIILTNDSHYWNTNSNNKTTNHGINRNFLIGDSTEGDAFLLKGKHNWYKTDGTIGLSKALEKDTSRKNSIHITNDYPYKWKEYCTPIADRNGIFKYMIVEINGTMETKKNIIKDKITTQLAKHIEKKYGYRWIKCVDLAMSASWWYKNYTIDELSAIDINDLVAKVFLEIDNDEIQ